MIFDKDKLSIFTDAFNWIKAQKQDIKVQFKLYISQEIQKNNAIEFLNQNKIIELTIDDLLEELP